MKQQIEQRLQSLKAEFAEGQKVLADLEAKQASVRDTLLRISGAIQVLEELVKANSDDNGQVSEALEVINNSQ
jgi:hypothetical protein